MIRRVLQAAPAASLAVCALTGCAPSAPAVSPSAAVSITTPHSSSAVPARLSLAQARQIYQHYRQQTQTGSSDDLHLREAGLALQISQATARLARLRGHRPTPVPSASPTPVPAAIIVPAPPEGGATTPPWFVVQERRGSDYVQLVLAHTPSGWRLVAGTTTPEPLPDIAYDAHGYATAVAASEDTGLIASPDLIAQRHAGLLSGHHIPPGESALLLDGTYTSEAAAARRADHASGGQLWRLQHTARAVPGIYALRTADGGAVAWYAIRERSVWTPVSPSAPPIQLQRADARLLTGNKTFHRRANLADAAFYLAVIPPEGGSPADSRAQVLGHWSATLSVTGT